MKKIEIKHLLDFKFPSAPAFSPDGKTVAFVVQQASLEENNYPGDIWLLDVETKQLRQLTNGGEAKSFFWTKHGTIQMFIAEFSICAAAVKECTFAVSRHYICK